MVRIALAVFLGLHGLVHVLGFLVPWQLMTSPDFAYTTSGAWGALELGDSGARVVGAGMLLLAIAYVVAAIGLARGTRWGVAAVVAVTAASLVLTILQAPAAVLGLVINVAVLVGLGLDRATGDPLHLAAGR
jgi:hypothetical protein